MPCSSITPRWESKKRCGLSSCWLKNVKRNWRKQRGGKHDARTRDSGGESGRCAVCLSDAGAGRSQRWREQRGGRGSEEIPRLSRGRLETLDGRIPGDGLVHWLSRAEPALE